MIDEYMIGIMRSEAGKPIIPRETPAEKAKRIGVPLIPKREFTPRWPEPNPTTAVCGECGLELKGTMGYSCPRSNCPCGLGSIYTLSH